MKKERLINLLRLGSGMFIAGMIGLGIKQNNPKIDINSSKQGFEIGIVSEIGDGCVYVDSNWGEAVSGINLRMGEIGFEFFSEKSVFGVKFFSGDKLIQREWYY